MSRVLLLLLATTWLACGPIGPLAGGHLRGDVHQGALPESWAFVDEIETVQLETGPDDPHSVNTWIGRHRGGLYVPTSLILGAEEPSKRQWVQNVQADPRVRLRIDSTVYELRARRVDDETTREAVRQALLAKYEVEADDHARRAWIYALEAR